MSRTITGASSTVADRMRTSGCTLGVARARSVGLVRGLHAPAKVVQGGEQPMESLSKRHQARIRFHSLEHRGLCDAIDLGELSLERLSPSRRIEVAERLLIVDHRVL